jgi:hypothetical protein
LVNGRTEACSRHATIVALSRTATVANIHSRGHPGPAGVPGRRLGPGVHRIRQPSSRFTAPHATPQQPRPESYWPRASRRHRAVTLRTGCSRVLPMRPESSSGGHGRPTDPVIRQPIRSMTT